MLSVEYPATRLACGWLTRNHGVQIVEHPVVLGMSDDEVLSSVAQCLARMRDEAGGLPRIANFCHVTSATAWIFPARQLCSLFHDHGVSVIVDGAQAAGHINGLCVRDIGADWYLGTCHKWMYSCPGVGFLVTAAHKRACTAPLVVSYFDGDGSRRSFRTGACRTGRCSCPSSMDSGSWRGC